MLVTLFLVVYSEPNIKGWNKNKNKNGSKNNR